MRHWPREWDADRLVADHDFAGVGLLEAEQQPHRVVLPDPDSPTSAWVLPRRDAEGDVVHRGHPAGADGEGLRHRADVDLGARAAAAASWPGVPLRRHRRPVPVGVDRGDVRLQLARVLRLRRREHVARKRPRSCTVPSLSTTSVVGPLGGDGQVVGDEQQADARATPCSSANRSRMRFWIVTSRPEVGSSATISAGRGSTASPISTRCSMPPGELVRVRAVDPLRVGQADLARRSPGRAPRRAAASPSGSSAAASSACDPIVRTAFSALPGSWGTKPSSRPRNGRNWRSLSVSTSWPSNWTCPAEDARLRREQPQHGSRDRRLARARLADQGQALPARQREAHVVHHRLVAVGDRQALDPQQRRGSPGQCWRRPCPPRPGRRAVQLVFRSHLLILLIERTVRTMTIAGQ